MYVSKELEDLQKRGANARAMGFHSSDNPMCKSENVPAKTGDTKQQWQDKYDAWERGWKLEDAILGGRQRA